MLIPGSEKVIPAFRCICFLMTAFTFSGVAIANPEDDYRRGADAYRTGDIVGAMTPLKLAADAGHARAQALYGVILDSAEMDAEAVVYLRKSAEQNDPEGQYALAKMYMTGEARAHDDAEAGRLMRLAAAQGHEHAIISLALAYVAGNGLLGAIDPSDPEAAQFIVKAAEMGDGRVMDALVKAYREGGFGLSPDAPQADRWAARLAKMRGEDKRTRGRR